MRVAVKPGRIKIDGTELRVYDADVEQANNTVINRVRSTIEFALCDEPQQRMLLAVAGLADECGIASGRDENASKAKGVSVAKLALRAGLPVSEATRILERLCRYREGERPHLHRIDVPTIPQPVWVLTEFEDKP